MAPGKGQDLALAADSCSRLLRAVADPSRRRMLSLLAAHQELPLQQEEEPRQRDQVDDQREHAVERIAQHDHTDRTDASAGGSKSECP